jgi:hypothetical protein
MKMSSVVGSAFMGAALASASPAMALEAGQCLPMAEMNAALRAEGQRTMIIGDRLGQIENDPNGVAGLNVDMYANAVTSNPDLSVGYLLQGDRPRTETSTRMCVGAKLANIRIFDAAREGVPQAALLGGRIDDVLRADEQIGVRPMVVADTVQSANDGSQRLGLPMVITANISQRMGGLYARQANGEPVLLARLAELDYTAVGLQRAQGTAIEP